MRRLGFLTWVVVAAAAGAGVGCDYDDGTVPLGAAETFALTDGNPASATYGQERTLGADDDRVVVLFFALYT